MPPLELRTQQKPVARTKEKEVFKPTRSEIRTAERVADQYVSHWKTAVAGKTKYRALKVSDSSVKGMPFGDVDDAINDIGSILRHFLITTEKFPVSA